MACDIQASLTAAGCLGCPTPEQQLSWRTALLCLWANNVMPPVPGNVIVDELGNPITDEFGNPLTTE